MKFLIFSCCTISFFGFIQSTEIPPFLQVCHKSDPDLKGCLIKALESLRPYLQTGSTEYNIPSVEPIVLKELIKEDAGGLKVTTHDVLAYGGGNFIIEDLEPDVENNLKFRIDVTIPYLSIEAKYSVDGKLVMVPIRGQGDFYANITDCKCKTVVESEVYQKDGEDYLRFVSLTNRIKLGGGKVRLENLFGGEKTLSEVINDTINKNLEPFVKELMPFIEKGLAANFLNTANHIIAPYTLKQIFPD